MEIGDEVRAHVDAPDGASDLNVRAPMPRLRTCAPQSRMGTSTMTHLVEGEWRQTSVVSNTLRSAERLFPKDVVVERGTGPMSQLLDGLGVSTIVRLDVVQDAQLVLKMPRPLN